VPPLPGGHQVRVKSWVRAKKRHGGRQRVIARDAGESLVRARFIGVTLMHESCQMNRVC
jgi:hypothetical protein